MRHNAAYGGKAGGDTPSGSRAELWADFSKGAESVRRCLERRRSYMPMSREERNPYADVSRGAKLWADASRGRLQASRRPSGSVAQRAGAAGLSKCEWVL